MDIMELIDKLEDVIDAASSLPLTGKSLIDREELFELISEIRLQLPEDLKQAKWVKEERQRILFEAQKEAEGIIKATEDKIVGMVNEHEITKKAQEQGELIIENAQASAKDIRLGTLEYADGALNDLEVVMSNMKDSVYRSVNDMTNQVSVIDSMVDIIRENRRELRN